MKVKSISSFFQKAGSSSKGAAGGDSDEDLVEVPNRIKKGKSKKKSKEEEEDKVKRGNSDDSDKEDPLPKSSRGKDKDKNGKSSKSKSRKAIVISDDSDVEDPLPKSSRKKEEKSSSKEKKRKAKVLSDSDEDDFKPLPQKAAEKPAKVARIEKQPEPKKKELKPINPADFFSSAPIKRENKIEQPRRTSPRKATPSPSPDRKDKPSTSTSSPPKSKPSNGNHASPQKPVASLIEPRKLKMETPTPEKMEKSSKPSSSKSSAPAEAKPDKSKKTSPTKDEPTFKAPTPVTKEKSKPRTSAAAQKRSVDDDEDDEDDFNPKKKVASTPSKKVDKEKEKPSSTSKKGKKTSGKDSTDDEGGAKEKKPLTDAQKAAFQKFLAKKSMTPRNLGSKEIPEGAPGFLEGVTFVISGLLDSLERDDCRDIVVKYGGRVTGSVSKKTNYLIIGDDPGLSKMKKAEELKIPQITEDEFLDMIRKSNPNGTSQDSGVPHSEEGMGDSEKFKTDDDYDADASLFDSPAGDKKAKSSPKRPEPAKSSKSPEKKKEAEQPKVIKKETSVPPSPVSQPQSAPADLMWVDKYKPKTLKAVVGQAADTSNAKKLLKWLQNWFNYHGSSQDKAKASYPGFKDPEGKTFKAALLSGPPGIGKTTTAHLVVKEVGYDYFELNASDTRNKRGLKENVADALCCKTLAFGKNDDKTTARRHVLIMDEVDGMSGNEDRGGVQELIGLIKTSRVPVICICNDRNHPKIRSLANYCFDLRFNKPSFEQLKGFVMSVCYKEKIKLQPEKIKQLILSTDNDVRQILHQLELSKESKSDQAYNPKKDLRFGPWDVIRKVLLKEEQDKLSIHEKNGLFFQDYNIGPLFVQENYAKWEPIAAGGNGFKRMDLISKTAASLADGDLVENVIRKNQNWGLLPVQAVFQSYIPGEYMSARHVGGIDFPQWLGKNSNKNKRHRLLQSLHSHLQLHVSGSLEALNMDYLPYLRRSLTKPLAQGDHESAAKVMEEYTLLRDDLDSITDLAVWPGERDPMAGVETKVKSAFTRQVNKEMLPYSNAKPVKKGRGGGNAEDDLEELLAEGEGEVVVSEEEDESIEKDAMVKMKKKSSSKASSSTSSKGKQKDEMPSSSKGKGGGKSRKGK